MIHKPAFHAHVTVRVLDSDTVLLSMEGEGQDRLLRGTSCGLVAGQIDGTRTADEVIDVLSGQADPVSVYYALRQLEAAGYLTSAESRIAPGVRAFWAMLGADPDTAVNRLRESPVAISTVGEVDPSGLESALSQLGIPIHPGGAFRVVLTDDYLNSGLHDINKEMLLAGAPWLIAKPTGMSQWIGPVFRTGVTGCWCCLAQRLAENRGGADRRSGAALPSSLCAALNVTATEVAKWLVFGKSDPLEGKIWTISASLGTATHHLSRLPQCHCCGHPDHAHKGPLTLQSRILRPGVRGRRTATAEQTVAQLDRHVSPITGIISTAQRIDSGCDASSYVYSALWNRGVAADARTGRMSRGAMGNGGTDAEARAACLAEAIERYSCCFRGDEDRLKARVSDLPEAVPPRVLLNFSEQQYRTRNDWNALHGPFQRVPYPFDDDCEIHWTEAWSLTQAVKRHVPTAYCFMGCTLTPDNRFFYGDSNGCASGNTIEEAILHGLLELIERDSVALWWYNRVKRPAVRVSGSGDPFLCAATASINRAGRTLDVLDISSDLDLPSCVAVSCRAGGKAILLGSGADLDPVLAVRRAVREVKQMIESIDRPRVVCEPPPEGRGVLDWLSTATLVQHDYLVPSGEITWKRRDESTRRDILEDIMSCVRVVERCGMEVLVVDMTRADIGFPTARVIVPGLRHFWPRFGPGRLYKTPALLAWVGKELSESELNPVPYML